MFTELLNKFIDKVFETKPETNKSSKTQTYQTLPSAKTAESIDMLVASGNINKASIINRNPQFNKTEEKTDYKELRFTKAKTIDEATTYTKNILGIQNYDFENDLETANHINEGLTNLQNIYKGKFRMPDRIKLTTKEQLKNSAMSVYSPLNNKNYFTLFINKDSFNKEKITKDIDELLDLMNTHGLIKFEDNNIKYFKAINKEKNDNLMKDIARYRTDKNSMTKYEIQALRRGIEDYANLCHYKNLYNEALENLYNNEEKLTKIKENYPTLPSKSDVDKMTQAEKTNLVYDINSKTGISMDVHYAMKHFDQFDILYHEAGHLMHEQILGNDKFYALNHKGTQSRATQEFLANKNIQNIAERVSNYAKTSPLEFVAETHVGLCNGFKFPKKIMDLYRYYNGPEP